MILMGHGGSNPPPGATAELRKSLSRKRQTYTADGSALVERISSGVQGLDAVIEGGFLRGNLILLTGGPGTGKTVLSTQFLVEGAKSGENGVYVSFGENREVLLENLSRHIGVDISRLESTGRLKILDLVTLKEPGISITLETILRELEAVKAKRLVIDSFTAMAEAFKEPIDVRVIVHTVLSRLVRETGCTTFMVEEESLLGSKVSAGTEEFTADGIIFLKTEEIDGRLLRSLELVKLRGTRLTERKLAFTLEGGFRAFPPFKPKPTAKTHRFQPIQDPPNMYSTGVRDLDRMLGGGLPKGVTVLLEAAEKVSTYEYYLVVLPLMLNFGGHGRGILLIPGPGVDAELARKMALDFGATEEEINRLLRVYEQLSPRRDQRKPYITVYEGKDAQKDYAEYLKLEEKLVQDIDQPVMSAISGDTLISNYGENACEGILSQEAIRIRERKSLGIITMKGGREEPARRLGATADIYLKLAREHGTLLLYGVKPRAPLFAVELDISKGYPMPQLTPIV